MFVLVVSAVDFRDCQDGNCQHLREQEMKDKSQPSREENLATAAVCGLVYRVIGYITGPSSCEAVHCRAKVQHTAQFRSPNSHRNVHEITRVSKHSEDDHEDNECGDPAPVSVRMDHFVSGKGDEERADSDDGDPCETGHVVIYCVDKLRVDDGIGCGPAHAG